MLIVFLVSVFCIAENSFDFSIKLQQRLLPSESCQVLGTVNIATGLPMCI